MERRGDGRRASRGQVSQPQPAREEDLLDGGGRTFFVVRKRPEGAAVKYWRSSQDTQLHVQARALLKISAQTRRRVSGLPGRRRASSCVGAHLS